LSQLACTGTWTRTSFGHRSRRRSAAFLPRWLLALSTIEKTRRADA
jgi:hypothetical protein